MAKLGDAFSEPERKKSALRRLVPGAVVYLEVVFPEGRKNKFLVVASVEAECCTFVVNSRVHPFVEATRFKGSVQRDVLDEIAAAVKRAPTLSTAEQARLVESLLREGD